MKFYQKQKIVKMLERCLHLDLPCHDMTKRWSAKQQLQSVPVAPAATVLLL